MKHTLELIKHWMDKVKKEFPVKSSGPLSHCLGNDYEFDNKQSVWHVGCKTHVVEAVSWVEEVFLDNT